MSKIIDTKRKLQQRKNRVRSTVSGTEARPRLSVYISNRQVSAQLINDVTGTTIASATTIGSKAEGTLSDKAAVVGSEIAKQAGKKKVKTVVLDRNGRLYEKRLQAFADAARKGGLEF
ncbi:50S ribosomal protein L18 [Candidatus Saccharibacteria bacterium]|nr:50S ribosomal protein L18 [Candidatus Saccharibacteria bacterium]